jgi:hypothetical protein
VNFYEVLLPGYYSPLTKTQITELFQAGQLKRNDACKAVAQREWKTIDELFPLLKYGSLGPAPYSFEETALEPVPRRLLLIFAALITGCAAIALCWYYFSGDRTEVITRSAKTVSEWPQIVAPTNPPPRVSRHAQVTRSSAPYPVTITNVQPVTSSQDAPAPVHFPRNTVASHEAQLAEQRRQADERQRNQIERQRLAAERARQEEKAAGQDSVIPLDRHMVVNVGGTAVDVMIHDNDTTSFDVWIDGYRRREVPKQKGISQSRTDETFLYGTGRANLYYVWELSGKVNHCRLRVREE